VIEILVKDLTGFQTSNSDSKFFKLEELQSAGSNWSGFRRLDVRIFAVSVVRTGDLTSDHWSLMLHTAIGHLIQVDLTPASYRVIYGARFTQLDKQKSGYYCGLLMLNHELTVGDVFKKVASIARETGEWSWRGARANNCQDFVVIFLANFGVTDSQLFQHQLRRTVLKFMPPLITEYNDMYNARVEKNKPIRYTSRTLKHSR